MTTISKYFNLFLFIFVLISVEVIVADCVVFVKPDSADWTLDEYQDQITENVRITRKHNQSLFNIAQEDGYSNSNGSPVGTLWAGMTTANASSANYSNFKTMHGGSPQSIIGDTVSLYLPDDDLYFDVIFTSYSCCDSGGGFSYIRYSVPSDGCLFFTKPDSADWTLDEYQDQITDSVRITRKHNQSLFNIAQEDGYSGSSGSPVGTLWANTKTENADSASYTSFASMHGGSTESIIGDTVSLYLPDDGLYFDVIFTSFSGGNSGGGFSYIRTPVVSLGLDDKLNPIKFFVSNNYPNPFNPVTTLAYQLSEPAAVSLKVYDLKGKQVMSINEGIKFSGSHDVTVNASTLSSGTYFFVFTAGNFQKTQKVMLLK